jgi:serine/threonine protein kinase/TPR repeat protein
VRDLVTTPLAKPDKLRQSCDMSEQLSSTVASWPRYALPRGTSLNGYTIESVLGSGGFGVTYLARDDLGQPFAIKEYFPREFATRQELIVMAASDEHAALFADCLDRFRREAQSLVRLSRTSGTNSGIVRVVTYFTGRGTGFLVMEYVEGLTLAAILRREPNGLAAERVSSLLSQLLSGVAIVHRSGLLHRDIKPANIIMRESGEVVIIDFGSSREAASGVTRTYTQIYSTGYAPLEQMIDLRQGPFSDIYAIGAVCYHAIGGKPVAALKRHLALLAGQQDPQVPAERIGEGRYPVQLLKAIDATLEVNPGDRPQDAEAVFDILGAGSTPFRGSSIRDTPIQDTQIRDTSIHDTPTRDTSIRGAPIRGTPIRFSSIRDAPLRDPTISMPRSRLAAPRTVSRRRYQAVVALACVLFLSGAAYIIPWNSIVNWKTAQEDGARREVARQEAARREALLKEVQRQEAVRQEAARQQAAQLEAARQETARLLEVARGDATRQPTTTAASSDDTTWSDVERRQVQSALTSLGYYRGPISGGFDPDTRSAIHRWEAFTGAPESDRLSNAQRDQILRDAENLAALLKVSAQSPRGTFADSWKGAQARFTRGSAFERGDGQPKDLAEAGYWYTLAATDGSADAFTNLGTLHANGSGLGQPDLDGAKRLWMTAGALGQGKALFNLGVLAESGIGGPADKGVAKRWYARGAERKDTASVAALKRLGG